MTFTNENIKYCLLAFAAWEPKHVEDFTSQSLSLSGLFNWSVAFNGDRKYPRTQEEFDKYNLLHVNITANNIFLIPDLIKKIDRNKTKLILNVDYALELWNTHFKHPTFLFHVLDMADYIFSVEERMAETLSLVLKRPVACIPHPTDITNIQKFKNTERWKTIGVMHHVYDQNIVLPALAINSVLEENPSWNSAAVGGVANEKEFGHLYTQFVPYTDQFENFIKYISQLYCMVESYTVHSYGRVTVEAAALGIPVIGSNLVSSQRRCFEGLTTEVSDILGTSKFLHNLLNDNELWTYHAQNAVKKSEYYSFENCKQLMLQHLNADT